MKKLIVFVLVYLAYILFGATLFAGDTYACINSKGDYINYGPPVPPEDHSAVIAGIVIAYDSARYEPRWSPMLDDRDLRRLIFLDHTNETPSLIIHNRP